MSRVSVFRISVVKPARQIPGQVHSHMALTGIASVFEKNGIKITVAIFLDPCFPTF